MSFLTVSPAPTNKAPPVVVMPPAEARVVTPTTESPAPTITLLLAVTTPMASTLVTSS